MSFIKKYAIPASFFSIVLVFLLHRIPLSDLFISSVTAYQANLLEDILINCFVLMAIFSTIIRVGIPLGLLNMQYKLFPYYLPLLSFVMIFSGGFSGVTNSNINFYDLDFTLFTIETLSGSLLEELLFRGLIAGMLLVKYWDSENGILKVVLYSSVLFGCTHLLNFWSQEGISLRTVVNQLLATTCLGFMMCVIYLKTRNILVLMAAHFCINFLGGVSFVGETEMVQRSIDSPEFTLNTFIAECFRLILFGAPLLMGLIILNRVGRDDIKKLVTQA